MVWNNSFQTYQFTANNIHSLEQLNALSQLRRIENLTVDGEGNPVTQLTMWKPYIVFRLAHFNVKTINGLEVGLSYLTGQVGKYCLLEEISVGTWKLSI